MNDAEKEDVRRLIEAGLELQARLSTVLPIVKNHSQYQHMLSALKHERDELRKYAKRAALHVGPPHP